MFCAGKGSQRSKSLIIVMSLSVLFFLHSLCGEIRMDSAWSEAVARGGECRDLLMKS